MRALILLAIAAVCAGCPPEKTTNVGLGNPDDGKTYTISGEVTGLAGTGLILRLNGIGDLPIPKGGPFTFTFAVAVDAGADYEVTVLTQPLLPTQSCTVTNGTGIANADVSNVIIACSTSNFLVGGAVSGLFGSGLVLGVNGQNKAVAANGTFTFDTPIEDLSDYTVSVTSQPQAPAQLCSLQAATGRINGRAVDTVRVDCRTVVQPAFSGGDSWNTYVTRGATTLTTPSNASACDAPAHTRYDECIHAGEVQAFVLHGHQSCAGLKATDALQAFDWVCDVPTPGDPPRFVSRRLAATKRLRDLLDTNTRTFKANSVTVTDASNATVATSAATTWWKNLVKAATETTLSEAGVVYLVDTDGAYTVGADRVSVVVTAPAGVTPTSALPANGAVLSVSGRAFVWIDGKVYANNGFADYGVLVQNSRFAVLRGFVADFADVGARIDGGAANALFDVVATNNATGIELANTTGTLVQRAVSVRSTFDGVTLTATSGVSLDELETVANGGTGLVLSSATNNDLAALRASNNAIGGVSLIAGSHHNRFARCTLTSNGGAQLGFSASNGNWWSALTGALGPTGIDNISANGNRAAQIAFASTGRPVRCAGGSLIVSDPTTDTAALDSTCVAGPTGPTAALDGAFVGMVITNDLVNPVDSAGTKDATALNISSGASGWFLFANAFRAWGKSVPSAFLDPTQRGACSGLNTCRIFDWSLKVSASDPLRAQFIAPTSADAVVHTWTDATTQPACDLIAGAAFAGTCTSTFLPHAIEIAHDEIGNDNWLCESDETCVLAPNIGSYQGHGLGASTTIGAGGTVENVVLIAPAENDGTKQ